MYRLLLRCLLVLVLTALAGCGNKGPLVLPDAPPRSTASVLAPAAAASVP